MKTQNLQPGHASDITRGRANPHRATARGVTIRDDLIDVEPVTDIKFANATVEDLGDGAGLVTFDGDATGGTGTSVGSAPVMTNSSGQDLLPGDVVVVDPDNDRAVTVTTTAGDTRIVGVVQEPISDGLTGRVLFNGLAVEINAPSAVRGEYAQTSTTAGMSDSTAIREAGSFAVYLTGTNLPDFASDGVTTEQDVLTTTFSIDMPAAIPAQRILFLALWVSSDATSISIPGWTRIGATSEFYYFTRESTGSDTATATWTTASTAVATVLLLHPNMSLAIPVEDFDYDSTTSAASISGLSDAPRYAIAGVQAAVTTPAGWTRLGGSEVSPDTGAIDIVQTKVGAASIGTAGLTFDSTVTVGSCLVGIVTLKDEIAGAAMADHYGGSGDPDWDLYEDETSTYDALGISAKIAEDTQSEWFTTSSSLSTTGDLFLFELEHATLVGAESYGDSIITTTNWAPGSFTVDAGDIVILAAIGHSEDAGWHVPAGFTQDHDATEIAYGGHPWFWVAHQLIGAPGTVTISLDTDIVPTYNWAAVALHLKGGFPGAGGTLVGKYIGHDSSVTSPFSGTGKENDGVFALNLSRDARPSALLYGPDLGGGEAFSGVAEDLTTAETDTTLELHPDGTGGVVWGPGGTDLGWFNIRDYGAVIDGSTDDTAAVQATIDAAVAAGGGVIYHPGGVCVIAGALLDTGAFNGQILLPNVSHAGDHIVLVFKGALRPGFHPVYGDTVPLASGLSVYKSTLTGASGTASVFSGGNDVGVPSSGHGNNLEVYVDDLVCLGPDNPTFTFWNLSTTQGGGVGALQISTPGAFAGSPTEPTHSNAYGIKFPQKYFANSIDIGTLSVGGFYTGVLDGELTLYRELILGPLINGIELAETFYPSFAIRIQPTSVQRVIVATGDHRFDVLNYVAEHSTTPAWAVTVYDLDDASNHMYGFVRWFNAATGGTPDHTFTVNGGANTGNQEMGSTWGGSSFALTIKDEGSALATPATSIDFVGSGVTATGTGAAKTVTIPGATAYDTDGLIEVYPGAYSAAGDPPVVTVTSVWGVSGGVPYYDASNVVSGEEAALYYNPTNDEFVLVPYGF